MKIKEAEYTSCGECGTHKHVASEEYGCDECKKPIDRANLGPKGSRQYLQAQVFSRDAIGNAVSLEFCSWKCCIKGLKKAKSNYFISLPYLHYDETQKGIRAEDFFTAIRAFK